MRLVWTTDLHLNHVPDSIREQWFQTIASHGANGIVISGDISEGDDVVVQLQRMARNFAVPLYFVLGNHDFYGSSIAGTRRRISSLAREYGLLHYLTDESAIEVGDGTFLMGEDGWGDATEGDYEGSPIRLNDFSLIDDFQLSKTHHWKQQLNDLGAESALRLEAKLHALPTDAKHALVITHVPPYCEACWYQGQTTDKNWAPFFVCGQLGQMLRRFNTDRAQCQLTVLCGHTHHSGIANIAPNLVVHTGGTVDGQPDVAGLVSIQPDGVEVLTKHS